MKKAEAQSSVYAPDENDMLAQMGNFLFLALVQSGVPADQAAFITKTVIDRTREIWAGDRAYIQRLGGRSQRNEAIRREHQAGERIPYLARKYHLTQRRIIQILEA